MYTPTLRRRGVRARPHQFAGKDLHLYVCVYVYRCIDQYIHSYLHIYIYVYSLHIYYCTSTQSTRLASSTRRYGCRYMYVIICVWVYVHMYIYCCITKQRVRVNLNPSWRRTSPPPPVLLTNLRKTTGTIDTRARSFSRSLARSLGLGLTLT